MAEITIEKTLDYIGDSLAIVEGECKSIRSEVDVLTNYIQNLEGKIEELEQENADLVDMNKELENEIALFAEAE